MVGWHHRHGGLESKQALGVGDGQGSLACCSLWGRKESETTERPNKDNRALLIFRMDVSYLGETSEMHRLVKAEEAHAGPMARSWIGQHPQSLTSCPGGHPTHPPHPTALLEALLLQDLKRQEFHFLKI